jgi:tricorn protease
VDPSTQPFVAHPPYRKPVVVLVNGAAISAGDIFTETMGRLPNVTLVGDTTGGTACQDSDEVNGDLRLPSGGLIHLPTRCALRYDGVPLELYGVPPDVRVTQTEADVRAGGDPQLERAIALLGQAVGVPPSAASPVAR